MSPIFCTHLLTLPTRIKRPCCPHDARWDDEVALSPSLRPAVSRPIVKLPFVTFTHPLGLHTPAQPTRRNPGQGHQMAAERRKPENRHQFSLHFYGRVRII